MWSDEYSVIDISLLKGILSKKNSMYSGFQQQDTQEFMDCLLDGLHEDLNRVVKKPYLGITSFFEFFPFQ